MNPLLTSIATIAGQVLPLVGNLPTLSLFADNPDTEIIVEKAPPVLPGPQRIIDDMIRGDNLLRNLDDAVFNFKAATKRGMQVNVADKLQAQLLHCVEHLPWASEQFDLSYSAVIILQLQKRAESVGELKRLDGGDPAFEQAQLEQLSKNLRLCLDGERNRYSEAVLMTLETTAQIAVNPDVPKRQRVIAEDQLRSTLRLVADHEQPDPGLALKCREWEGKLSTPNEAERLFGLRDIASEVSKLKQTRGLSAFQALEPRRVNSSVENLWCVDVSGNGDERILLELATATLVKKLPGKIVLRDIESVRDENGKVRQYLFIVDP